MVSTSSTSLLILSLIQFTSWAAAEVLFFGESELGVTDLSVTAGNPMKGLAANPDFFNYDPSVDSIDSSMDVYYIPLSDVLVDDPDVVGNEEAFDWEPLERRLNGSATFARHAVLSFAVHYPSEPLYMPQYVLDKNITLQYYPSGSGLLEGYTPDYGEEAVLRALEQFVSELGRKYDGDSRVAVIHLGLLGFWGEWHTYPLTGLVPDYAKERITTAYSNAFSFTKLQGRYPYGPTYEAGFGLYDASFAFNTLDGEPNGGIEHHWYFWPSITQSNQTDFWRRAPMGSETRPEIQNKVFGAGYPAGTYERQDFNLCVETTHNSYTFHQDAFVEGGYAGDMLDMALEAHSRMGYSFVISGVSVSFHGAVAEVNVDVTQVGVAPFYYPLDLTLSCAGMSSLHLPGVEQLIDEGEKQVFNFTNIPNDPMCLSQLTFTLSSSATYDSRPIKFAQGDGTVRVVVPTTAAPTLLPTTNVPTQRPTTSPTAKPSTNSPTLPPTTSAPTQQPRTSPTVRPTDGPATNTPTHLPTTKTPTQQPTTSPISGPTDGPTTNTPTQQPTTSPTAGPTDGPTTSTPTPFPTTSPTQQTTTSPTGRPTDAPTKAPTTVPTKLASSAPTKKPTGGPTRSPTLTPTENLSFEPTEHPSILPTQVPGIDVSLALVRVDGSATTAIQNGSKFPVAPGQLSVTAYPNTDDSMIGHVKFEFPDNIKYEGVAPYTIAGDNQGISYPFGYLDEPGEKFITVTVHGVDGSKLVERSVTFEMVAMTRRTRHLQMRQTPSFKSHARASATWKTNSHAVARIYEQPIVTAGLSIIHASNTPWGPSLMQIVYAERTGIIPRRLDF